MDPAAATRADSEAASRRTERVQQAASLARSATLRAYDEPALLEETCHILVEQADYTLAWIGEALDHPGQAVAVRAAAPAPAADFTRMLRLSWAVRSDRRHPAPRAIREQRPQVQRAPFDARHPLAADLEHVRFGSLAAFPLQFPPHGLGVLVVAAPEQDAFGLREMTILRELAADVALGIATLREKQARDRLEAELEATQQRYRGIIENAPEGILETSTSGDLRLVNRSLARLLGYASPDEILHVTREGRAAFAHHVDPRDLERFQSTVRDGGPWPIELRLLRKDGSRVWASLNATVVQGPDGPAIECFVQDLTATRARREALARLAAIVEATDEAIIALDTDAKVLSWNAGAASLFGYAEAEAMGRSIQELIVPDDRHEETQAALERLRKGERVPHFETRRRRKDGSLVEVSVSASPILDETGVVVGIAVTQHDITERKRGEAARRVLERQEAEVTRLSELERMRAAFLSEASHEINTPLTTIRLQLDVLKMMPTIDERERASLNIIEGSVTRMARLVKDMLEASGLRAGRLKLQRVRTDMAKTIEDAVVTFGEYGKRAGVEIRHKPGRRFYVDADPTRAMQVLFNLLSNAVKFTPRGGVVEVSSHVVDGVATVTVTDTGLGMTEEQVANLFVPFGRLHEHVPGIALGTGLGLFISKGIVEQHGGRLWATSPGPGKGSTFAFTLPLAPPPKQQADGTDGEPATEGLGASKPVVVRKRPRPAEEGASAPPAGPEAGKSEAPGQGRSGAP